MPTIVRHEPTQKRYLLLGPAYGYSKTNRTSAEFDTGYATFEHKLVAACDADGVIHWLNATETTIESIDGQTCREALAEQSPKRTINPGV